MSWSDGTMSGFGTLTIANGAGLILGQNAANAVETLDGVTLNNGGITTILDYKLALENSAGIDNQSGGSFTFLNYASQITSDGTATFFKNEGILTQAGSYYGEIDPTFTQTGTGSTVVQTGELDLGGSNLPITNSGSMTIERRQAARRIQRL